MALVVEVILNGFIRNMMFKIPILQSINYLADGKTKFMILDRLSLQRLLGLRINDAVPAEKKIREFRNKLVTAW